MLHKTYNNNMLANRPIYIIPGSQITKARRIKMFGGSVTRGGSLKPEKYQRKAIEEGTGIPCVKTNIRINLRTSEMHEIAHPNKQDEGFDFSEDFDGVQTINNIKIYYDLKCIVGDGGNQTRSLREVYWFVEAQHKIAQTNTNVYFVNILDGDVCEKHKNKFKYQKNLPQYLNNNNIYVGDLHDYFTWFNRVILPSVN